VCIEKRVRIISGNNRLTANVNTRGRTSLRSVHGVWTITTSDNYCCTPRNDTLYTIPTTDNTNERYSPFLFYLYFPPRYIRARTHDVYYDVYRDGGRRCTCPGPVLSRSDLVFLRFFFFRSPRSRPDGPVYIYVYSPRRHRRRYVHARIIQYLTSL